MKKEEKKYQICSNCVMDTSDSKIVFDKKEYVIIVIIFMKIFSLIGIQKEIQKNFKN